MVNHEMIAFIHKNKEGADLINITKLWEFMDMHEKIVREDEKSRIKKIFTDSVSSSVINFLIEIEKKN